MYVVTLTPDELDWTGQLAAERAKGKRGDGLVMRSDQPTLARHTFGLRAEYAVARELLGRVDERTFGRAGDGHAADVRTWDGVTIEVKARTQRGWAFALRGTDLAEFRAGVGVLVWPAEGTPADGAALEIMGYVTRQQFARLATRQRYVQHERREAWRLAVEAYQLRPFVLLVARYRRQADGPVPLAQVSHLPTMAEPAPPVPTEQDIAPDIAPTPVRRYRPEPAGDALPVRTAAGLACPACGRLLDSARACWTCGTAFCRGCGHPSWTPIRPWCAPCSFLQVPATNPEQPEQAQEGAER